MLLLVDLLLHPYTLSILDHLLLDTAKQSAMGKRGSQPGSLQQGLLRLSVVLSPAFASVLKAVWMIQSQEITQVFPRPFCGICLCTLGQGVCPVEQILHEVEQTCLPC